MTHASVFSGIGGPEVAAVMLGWENLFHCEINPFGRHVLDYWFPKSKSYEDITKTDFSEWRGRVDVLTGGFPCQPFSYAGKRRGAEDDRYLWPHMYRCIDEIRPTWVIGENVAGILSMVEQGEVSKVAGSPSLFAEENDVRGEYELKETFTIERICTDLERHGYAVQPILIPACAVGAPHRRDRVFIVGRRVDKDSDHVGLQKPEVMEHEPRQGHARTASSNGQVRQTAADSVGGGEGTSRACGEPESGGSHADQQPEEWSSSSEWSNRFYAVLRHVAHADINGLQHNVVAGSEAEDDREKSEHSSELHDAAPSNGCGRTTADTTNARTEGVRRERKDAVPRFEPITNPDGDGGNERNEHLESELADGAKPVSNGREWDTTDSEIHRHEYSRETRTGRYGLADLYQREGTEYQVGQRWQNFPSVSPVHRGNDGIPIRLDNLSLSFGKWRTESLKAYGNAIVPQVMYEIFRAIEIVENEQLR